MPIDAITLVTKDHRAVENLFARLQEKTGDRARLLEELRTELLAHAKAEEAVLYPFIKQAVPEERKEVDEGSREHHEVEQLLEQLSGLAPDDKEVDGLLERLESAVTHHVEEEENDVLPGLEEAVDEADLRQLGEAFQERKAQELRRIAGGGPAAESASPSAPETGAEEKSKQELLEQAREADIEGRSKMSKEELAEALESRRS